MTSVAASVESWRSAFAAADHDLVQGWPESLTADQARQLKLGSWCYFAAQAGTVYRQELAGEFAREWQVQRRRAEALIPLLQAWQCAGIRAVAFKGFALAWAVYPHPAVRVSADVDLLLARPEAERALGIAVPGWRMLKAFHRGDGREAFTAFHEASGVSVDVQVGLLPEYGFTARENLRITEQVLHAATWQTTVSAGNQRFELRTVCPADMLLLLAVNRAWTTDAWRNKPHDYLDMAFAIQKFQLSKAEVAQRAAELGVTATWEAFLRHCNAFESRLDLFSTRYNVFTKLRNEVSVVTGGLPPRLRMVLNRARRAKRVLWRAAQVAPTLLQVVRELRRYPTPADVSARAVSSGVHHDGSTWQVWEVEQATRWAHRLLGPVCRLTDAGECVVHSLTLFRMMQKHGHPARWCLGYPRSGPESVIAHAWVECDDIYAFGLQSALKNRQFQVVFSQASTRAQALAATAPSP